MPDCILTPPTNESVIIYTQLSGVQGVDTQSHVLQTIQTQFSDINLSFVSQQATASQVIDDVMRQLSFDETKLDGEAGLADVARGGVDSSGLSHDESFGVDDIELNLNEPVNLNVSQVKTQSKLHVSEEPDVGRTQEPILSEEFSVEDVVVEDYASSAKDGEDGEDVEQGIDTAYETEYDVQYSEGAGTDDDDDDEEKKFTTPKEAKDRVYMHSIESRRNLKLYKNDGVRIRARCDGKVPVFTMSQGSSRPAPTELKVQISMSKAFRAKAKAKREIRGDHVLHYSMLRDYVVELQSTNPNTTVKIAVERNTDPSLPTRVFQRIYICLRALKLGFRACRRDLLGLDGAFMKGPFPGQVLVAVGLDSNNGIYPLAYALVEAKTAYATSVKEFEKCMLELKTMNPKAHEWLNKIPVEHWARSHFSGRAKSDLLLNNICEVFNGKIIRRRDKPVITLLEYIKEYCMKRIMIDKCIGPLIPTATRIIESIKKEAHLIKVQWNRANKSQVSGSLGDQCVVDVVSMTCSCKKWELTGIPCKHVVAACWNMALNDRATPSPETWVNPCYWLSTWKETYSHKIQPICGTKYWEKSTCPTTLLPPKHHVQVGRPRKKRKRSKHKNEPFVKDGKLSRIRRTITCQSCGNTRHNKATCKGQGQKATTVGQDGSDGSGVGAVIGLSAAGEGGADVASQGSSRMSETRNADGREMGDGVPT
ncbi:heat stress transcription factor B-4-like protein [Tanacetum coccineum]